MKNFVIGGLIFLIYILATNSIFVVRETERAVMLQFGDMVDPDIPRACILNFPGLIP